MARDSRGGKIRDVDRGAKALLERIASSVRTRVTVGIHEAEGSASAEEGDGLTVLDVGTINEFGGDQGDNPPRRSFLADWADENEEKLKSDMRKIGAAVVAGKLSTLEQGFERLGLRSVAEIQQRIKAGIDPENADSTIERKGSSTPLINHGQLWTSITHKVEKN